MNLQRTRQELQAETAETVVMPSICPGDIHISPAEKFRYRENRRFGSVMMNVFERLMTLDANANNNVIIKELSLAEPNLSEPQKRNVRALASLVSHATEQLAEESTGDIIRKFNHLRKLEPGFPEVLPEDVTLLPLGFVCVTFDELYRFGGGMGKVFRPHDPVAINSEADKEAYELLWRTAFVKKTVSGTDSPPAQIKKHEFFHLVNHAFIEPVTTPSYHKPVEQELFRMIKDEVIAYLVEGRWEFLLERHFDNRWNKETDPSNALDAWDRQIRGGILILDKLHQVYAHPPKDDSNPYSDKALSFYLEIFFLQREIARLQILSCTDTAKGIEAIIAAQSFKEMGYALSSIGPASVSVDELFWSEHTDAMKENLAFVPINQLTGLINVSHFFRIPIRGLSALIEALRHKAKLDINHWEAEGSDPFVLSNTELRHRQQIIEFPQYDEDRLD